MPRSSDFGLDDDDTEFFAAATQIEASQRDDFQPNPRPTKRRRVRSRLPQIDGVSSQELEWSETDEETHSPPKRAVATQNENQQSPEPEEVEEDLDYYLPGELVGPDDRKESAAKQSKYRIHVPKEGGQFQDQVFTQTQVGLDSSPSHFRGAVWKRPKPAPPPPPIFNEQRNGNAQRRSATDYTTASAQRQGTLIGFAQPARHESYQSDAALAARLQAQENATRRLQPMNGNVAAGTTRRESAEVPDELADLPSDAFASSPEKSPRNVIEISSQATASQVAHHGLCGPQHGLKQMTIFGQAATQNLSSTQAAKKKHAWPLASKDEKPTHHKLDEKAMETWVYPTNLGTIRDYQYNIVARSLFHNTLVALPTGLGKTFIAATVMLNYYRWTTNAQVVFMAPTKPLIAQQMEACYNIVGIHRRDTVLMTGETTPALRSEEWLEKRVFFMTPQTVINDLKTGICDPKRIVLVVVDEAHKSTGGYAYTEVIKFMRRFNESFRVLALTATPGSKVETVQGVIDALGIARVELRTEQSLDITQYTHEKHTETELFDISDEQALVMEHMTKALKPVLEKLCTQNAYWSRDPMQLTAYGLTTARQKYMASDAGKKAAMPIKGMINAIFTVLSSLAHSISLLKFHGIGPFHGGMLEFQKNVHSGQTKSKYAAQIAQSEDFTKMMTTVRGWTNDPDFIGHPKLHYLREVVLNHFLDTGEGGQGRDVPPSATRVMVFASYRDSTEEICRVLKRNEPMIRPHVFVGQAASKGSEGMDQKKQNAVIQDFKAGKYNTLVATSIGEEGLDIGDVDLIVCYDASSSPIRMLQRIGRTGRKRVGRVQLLLMRGKEENDYAKAQDNYAYIQKTIADASKYTYHDDRSPRILPREVKPVVDKRVIEIPIENSQPIDLNEKGRKARGKGKAKPKRPPKKFHMPSNVRTGFVKASKMGSDDEAESEEEVLPKEKAAAKVRKTDTAKSKREPIVEPVQLPFLEDVLLTRTQEAEWERLYAHTADDEAEGIVRAPDLSKIKNMSSFGATKYVGHGHRAAVVERALQAVRAIDAPKIDAMKKFGGPTSEMLRTMGDAGVRLVSPSASTGANVVELPDDPLAREPSGLSARKVLQKRKKARASAERTKSIQTNASADLPTKPPPKKPRGRPRKINRAASFGSAASEGEESEPEPTPAYMKLPTQGIHLGSRDTDGSGGEEDMDVEGDSELGDFVVASDQSIEMQGPSSQTILEDEPGLDDSDRGGAESSDVEEVVAPARKGAGEVGARARRRVVESDSDE